MKPEVLAALKTYQASLPPIPAAYPAFVSDERKAFNVIAGALRHGARLDGLVNNPETDDFLRGVRLEAVHQVEKWGDAHDRGKSAENWCWLVGYLAGKCLRAVIAGDRTKAMHHTISSAAALFNWHAAIKRDTTGSGIGHDEDIRPVEIARFEQSDREHVRYLGGSGHGGTIVV